jgi:hypothetical protein
MRVGSLVAGLVATLGCVVARRSDIASLTLRRGVMPAHGWIFSCLSSIPMNCSIRRARVSAFFAV